MNLDPQDITLLREIVEDAVAKSTRDLVTKDEFSQFRAEMTAAWDRTYTREMVDQFFKENRDERDRLWAAVKKQEDILKNLWESAGGKVLLVGNLVLVIYA